MKQLMLPFMGKPDNRDDHYTWSDIPRPVEDKVFRRMARAARKKTPDLTNRQREALVLSRQAKRLGLTPSIHVADCLKINRHSAYKLLMRIAEKMETSPHLVTLYSETEYDLPYATRRQIIERRSGMTVRCACHGTDGCKGHASARYGICSVCAETYGYPNRMNPATKGWLPAMIKQVINQAYSDARRYVERQIIESTPPGKVIRQAM